MPANLIDQIEYLKSSGSKSDELMNISTQSHIRSVLDRINQDLRPDQYVTLKATGAPDTGYEISVAGGDDDAKAVVQRLLDDFEI